MRTDEQVRGPVASRGKRLGFALVLLALTVLGIEAVVRTAARAGWVQIKHFGTRNEVRRITFVGNLNPHFGIWHLPRASVTVSTPAGPVVYESNAHGMRDPERELRSTARERVVVLGDSFVEGFFVAASNRFTNLLEAETGVEFLNFGTSGGFGTIQEWLLYEHLARRFDHSRVLLFLLPDNDFADNDPARSAGRYQPCLQKSNGTYVVRYPGPFRSDLTKEIRLTRGRAFRHACYNRWHTLNLLMAFDYETLWDRRGSAYSEFSDEDLAQLLFTFERIREAAHPRPLTLFIIPRDRDFVAHADARFRSRLPEALAAWAAQREGVRVVDLYPGFAAYMRRHQVSHEAFFLGFDPHWSPLGHRVAAGLVRDSLADLRP